MIINFNIITAVIAMWGALLLVSAYIIILRCSGDILCLILSLIQGASEDGKCKKEEFVMYYQDVNRNRPSSSGFFSAGLAAAKRREERVVACAMRQCIRRALAVSSTPGHGRTALVSDRARAHHHVVVSIDLLAITA